MKKSIAALCLLVSAIAIPQAKAADLNEYVQDTVMLPVRTAAILSALTVTTPVRAVQGGLESANACAPKSGNDTLVFEYAAVPIGFAAGAIAAPFNGAGQTINKAWEKPFSTESFSVKTNEE